MSANAAFFARTCKRAPRSAFGCLLVLLGSPTHLTAAEPQVTEGFINASQEEVWRLFTTAAGRKLAGAAEADVDLRLGGEIRAHAHPAGRLGDADTLISEILAYEPARMLALRVKRAPANEPHRDALSKVWTVFYFTPAGENMTQVRIVGLGYDDGAESQALRERLADDNRRTLERIAKPFWPQCKLCEKGGAD